MFTKFLSAWLLLCSVALGQIDVKSATYYQVTGLGELVTVGDMTLVPSIPKIESTPIGVVTIESQSTEIEVSFTDQQRVAYPAKKIADKNWLVGKPGKYWVEVREYGDIKLADGTTRRLMLDSKTVVVDFKFEPGPGPGPTPPPPTPPVPPPPDVAPIDGSGLRVLFVSESSEQMSPSVQEIFYSPKITAWLNANCVKVDGHPEFRRVDPDTGYTDPNHRFAKAMVRPRESLPWLIISNGTTGYEGPFPPTVDATLELLKKYKPAEHTALPEPPSVSVVVHTIRGCAPCHEFIVNELPKLADIDIKVVTGGARVYPTYTITTDKKTVSLTGRMSAEGLRQRIQEFSE